MIYCIVSKTYRWLMRLKVEFLAAPVVSSKLNYDLFATVSFLELSIFYTYRNIMEIINPN